MLQKDIIYWGRQCTLACDGKCTKAWGTNSRRRNQLSTTDDDDFEFLSDKELGHAPTDPGTYEGGDAKPTSRKRDPSKLNKWCARECERSIIVNRGEPIDLPSFIKRLSNIRSEQAG